MHDILEGSLYYEMKLMLQVMVNTGYFSLDDLNMRLENFELGYMESKNRPSLFSAKNFNSDGKSLKQNGELPYIFETVYNLHMRYIPSQMIYLATYYLCSLDILYQRMMNIGNCSYNRWTDASYTSALISKHHQDFCRLYVS